MLSLLYCFDLRFEANTLRISTALLFARAPQREKAPVLFPMSTLVSVIGSRGTNVSLN